MMSTTNPNQNQMFVVKVSYSFLHIHTSQYYVTFNSSQSKRCIHLFEMERETFIVFCQLDRQNKTELFRGESEAKAKENEIIQFRPAKLTMRLRR